MTRLTFAPVPNGPFPLFLGEPADEVAVHGHLLCDHAAKTVYFRPADPFEAPRQRSIATVQRFSFWEVDAMMPRRQVLGLYEEVKPLLERLDAATALRMTPEGWVCTRAPEAAIAEECIDELLSVQAEDPAAAWLPSSIPALHYFDSGAREVEAKLEHIRAAIQQLEEVFEKRDDLSRGVTAGLQAGVFGVGLQLPRWINLKPSKYQQVIGRGARLPREPVAAVVDGGLVDDGLAGRKLLVEPKTYGPPPNPSALRRFGQFFA